MNAHTIVQLTHSESTFVHLAEYLVLQTRRSLFVPDQADEEVEAEFRALRSTVDGYFPEFCEIFSDALLRHVDEGSRDAMLEGLATADAQRHLEALACSELEIEQSLPRLNEELSTLARTSLQGEAQTLSKLPHSGALRLVRLTGASEVLNGLALAAARDASQRASGGTAQLQSVQNTLMTALTNFYARTYIRHVGQQHVAATLQLLEREPLRQYTRARTAMRADLARGVAKLVATITSEVLN